MERNGYRMPLQNIQFEASNGLQANMRNNIRPIAIAAVDGLGAGVIAVVDMPEFLAAVLIVGIALSILLVSHLAFSKSREILGGIWLVGNSIVKGLDKIDSWISSLFNWLDTAAHEGIQNIAHFVHDNGSLVYDFFARPDQARIANLESAKAALQRALTAENTRAYNAEQGLAGSITQLNDNLTKIINNNKAQEVNDFNALTASIAGVLATLKADFLTARKDLVNEANTRSGVDTSLQQEIDAIASKLEQEFSDLSGALAGEETALTGYETETNKTLQAAAGEISTLQDTATLEGKTITGLETTISNDEANSITKTPALVTVADWTLAEVVTLTELAKDPCMCLGSIGGEAGLAALVAALEVGIL